MKWVSNCFGYLVLAKQIYERHTAFSICFSIILCKGEEIKKLSFVVALKKFTAHIGYLFIQCNEDRSVCQFQIHYV